MTFFKVSTAVPIKVADWIRKNKKDITICNDRGIESTCVNSFSTIGLLLGDSSKKFKKGFLFKRKNRRPFICKMKIIDDRKFIFEVYGKDKVLLIKEIAEEMQKHFKIDTCLVFLHSECEREERYLTDFDW